MKKYLLFFIIVSFYSLNINAEILINSENKGDELTINGNGNSNDDDSPLVYKPNVDVNPPSASLSFPNFINISGNGTELIIKNKTLEEELIIPNTDSFNFTKGIVLTEKGKLSLDDVVYNYIVTNKNNLSTPGYFKVFDLNDGIIVANNLKLNATVGVIKNIYNNTGPIAFYMQKNSNLKLTNSQIESEFSFLNSYDSISNIDSSTLSFVEPIISRSSIITIDESTLDINRSKFMEYLSYIPKHNSVFWVKNGIKNNSISVSNSIINIYKLVNDEKINDKEVVLFDVDSGELNNNNNFVINNVQTSNLKYLLSYNKNKEQETETSTIQVNNNLTVINSDLNGDLWAYSDKKQEESKGVLSLILNNSEWKGDAVANGNTKINIEVNGSTWNGSTSLVDTKEVIDKSIINVNVNSGTWNITDNSAATKITSENNAIINLKGNSLFSDSLINKGTLLINESTDSQPITTITGNIDNSGLVYINTNTETIGKALQVNGNWDGKDGTIFINTTLNGDTDSSTDKLIINGKASGTTLVSIKNQGGEGAKTLEGIEIINTKESEIDAFKQKDRVVAGNYEYHLQQGTASGNNTNSWYLTSKYNDSEKVTRPESGSYIGNLQAAGTMFNTTLKDRQGGGTYINPVTGEVYTSSVWARSVGSHQKGNISGGQSDYKANKFVFQIGGDVMNGSLQDNDEYHIGVMAGYGNQHNHSNNHISGYNSKGSLWGYSAGFYGTWYQDTKTNTGLYVDSWVLYNWFNNSVHGDELAYENYKTKGFTASIESGYAFKLGTYPSYGETTNTVYITPQAQAIWSGVKADKHKESNGTNVEGVGNNNVQTRLGVRLSIINEGKNLETVPVRPLMPFVEANWIYTSKEYGVSMNNEKAYFEGTRNIGEVKAGLEADLSHNVTVWGNIAQQFGSHSYQNTQGMLGIKYAF